MNTKPEKTPSPNSIDLKRIFSRPAIVANLSLGGLSFCFIALSLVSAVSIFSSSAPTDNFKSIEVDQLPMTSGAWQGQRSGSLGHMEISVLQLDSWLKRSYTRTISDDANKIGNTTARTTSLAFYLGYWKQQTGDYQAAKHSPLGCFPANGWSIYDIERRSVPLDEVGATFAKTSRLTGDIDNNTYVTYYWFFTGDNIYPADWQAMMLASFGTLLVGRSDGGIVEITAPVQKGINRDEAIKNAQDDVEDFIRSFYPDFLNMLSGKNEK